MSGRITLPRPIAAAVLALALTGAADGPARSDVPEISAPEPSANYCKDGAARELELPGIGTLGYCIPLNWVDYEQEPLTLDESVFLDFDRDDLSGRFHAGIEILLSPLLPKPDQASVKTALMEVEPSLWRRRRLLQPRIQNFEKGSVYGYSYRTQDESGTEMPYHRFGTAGVRDLMLRFESRSKNAASEAHDVVLGIVKSIKYQGTRPLDPAVADFQMSPSKARGVNQRAITESLVGEWTFDEQLGRTAYDTSSRGHHGRIEGADWGFGAQGAGGLLFDGSSYIEVPDHADFDLAEGGTLHAWVRYSDVAEGGQVLGKCSDSGSVGDCNYALALTNPFSQFVNFCVGEGPSDLSSCTQLSSHGIQRMVWYQVVVSYDGSLLRTYVNGRLQRLDWQTIVPAVNDFPLLIGSGFEGRLDDVRIYDRALTAQEVASLYVRPRKN